jgi:glycosyltransferase involved in cell wall biosynthesis
VRNRIEYLFRPPARLRHAVADARPDVVHVNGLIFPARTWLLRQTLKRRTTIVVQDHGGGAPGGRTAVHRAIHRGALRAADAFLFAAAEQAGVWQRAGLIPSNRRVYQVMESSATFRPLPQCDARQASGMDGEPAILWVGRLNANKDPLTVLSGFELTLAESPSATLTMVHQEDDLLPAVRERVQTSPPLRGRVRLVGRVAHERLASFYSAADIFVAGSHSEGSGYALLEACACGVIPVVTDIPTFRVITDGGRFGSLWQVGDARACAKALVAAARADRAVARARITGHFERALSWSAIGRDAMAAYQDAVAGRLARL